MAFDILSKYEHLRSRALGCLKSNYGTEHSHPRFKRGDIVEYWAGYNDDIRFSTEVLSFDSKGGIYLLWDTYWVPIFDDESRSIRLLARTQPIPEVVLRHSSWLA